jgi:hypothetical protein
LTRSLVALGALLAATAVYPQAQNPGRNLNVMAVNLDNHEVYSVTFTPPGGSTTVGNTDENNYVRPDALAFVANATTNQLDLVITDNQRGTIYRYPGALAPQMPPNPTTATLVWNAQTAGTGPLAPDAAAVDGNGNLFVTNSTSGHSTNAQLWMFPVGAAGSGSFNNPVLLDSNFQTKETLLEVALVPTDVAGATGVSGGDLILLSTSAVYAYSQSSGYTSRTVLLSFPNGSPVGGGMDFWPFGNGAGANYSLLISSNNSSTISRYYFTNPLTAAPGPFYSGLSGPYRLKTIFQQGNPVLVVSQNGSILELGADASGNGTLQATVTQNVTVPQGLAVSNSFTGPASVCQQPGGCNLTGIINHKVKGAQQLSGNMEESVCTVRDPRVSIIGGVWACNVPYTPPAGFSCPTGTPPNGPGCLPVNAFCPGLDDTGTMAVSDMVCGSSGRSGADLTFIKTLIKDNQFFAASGNGQAGAYVQNEVVDADGSEPLCGAGAEADGAFLWGALKSERNPGQNPNMKDITSGCGSGKGGTSGLSVFAGGGKYNEGSAELNPPGGLRHPLWNLVTIQFQDLTNLIDQLTQTDPNHTRWTDNFPNLGAGVSLQLWGGNVPPANNVDAFGCVDQAWALFYNAAVVDTEGSLQQVADLTDAANWMNNADATGNTTCGGILDYAQANTATAFVQTPNAQYPNAPTVLNPYGQLVSLAAGLNYSMITRLLGKPGDPATSVWPLSVSVNVVPTSVTLASNSSPGSATLSWNTNGATGCTLGSSDGQYPSGTALSSPMPLTIPAGDAGSIVTYTVSCTGGPPVTTAKAYVNVYPPPTLVLSQPSILQGGATTLTWNTNHAQGCTASTTDPTPADAFSGAKNGTISMPLNPTAAGSYTYTLACTSPAVVVQANLLVIAPPTVTLSAPTIVQGSGATLAWNATGESGCTWSSNDSAVNGKAPSTNPTPVNPAAGTYNYTLNCTTPFATASQQVSLTVVQQPTVTFNSAGGPTSWTAVQGIATQLYWGGSAAGCSWNSTDNSFSAPAPGTVSGSVPVNPTSAGNFTYTLTCPAPTVPAIATLTVNAPPPPSIYVSQSSITLGGSATVHWTINTGDVCTGSSTGTDTNPADAFTGMKGVTGSMIVTPNATGIDTYTLNCTVPPVNVSTNPPLTVNPQPANIAIGLAPYKDGDNDYDQVGDQARLSWSLSGGTSGCHVSGTWPAHSVPQFMSPFAVASSGSVIVTFGAAGTYTYTLSCTNPAAPVQTSAVISSHE